MVDVRLPKGIWSYDPKNILGRPGGFGAVYLGKSSDDKEVAIKKLHISAEQAAHRELEMAGELVGREFKNVMPVLDAGQDAESDAYFVVMPVAECSLQDYLEENGKLSKKDSCLILRQITHGLIELPNIVHRDLKPGNVLRCDGKWLIADFGIARFLEETTSARTLKDCLSPLYAAPEQWRYERATHATDVYALGCIASSLLTGKPPFSGTTDELQEQHLHGNVCLPDCSPLLQMLLSMMLRKEPETRPSLSRVLTLLEKENNIEPPSDKSLEKLAIAAVAYEKELGEAEAASKRHKYLQEKRSVLSEESKRILVSIFESLTRKIQESVPTARLESVLTSSYIYVGTASLELDVKGMVLLNSFPLSKWDVVCGAVIEVNQASPPTRRSANLWYTKMANPEGNYRWYEVGYEANHITGRSFEYEPTAVTMELADKAHCSGMGMVQCAYSPVPIDDEHMEAFCQRWTSHLADACAGKLPSRRG